ncbi:glycosyl hydrolases family 31-domain-containing protein [Lipomyces japonicus]|uniref:glycosyl hydrolases family 31-domain-containing protein n=1 Tax=Lipomyces japonicus TaxID=56871 RepID=UPI0034CE3572
MLLALPAEAAKKYLFKTCEESSFCRRNRAYADFAESKGSSWTPPYSIDPASVKFKDGALQGTILKLVLDDEGNHVSVDLPFQLVFLQSGSARFLVDEKRRSESAIPGFPSDKITQKRYNEASKWAIVGDLSSDLGAFEVTTDADVDQGIFRVRYGPEKNFEAIFQSNPFQVKFYRDGEPHVILNDRKLFNLDHWRPKPENLEDASLAEETDVKDMWQENFGGKEDKKPKGCPESIALDITFPGYEHVFGIPEHADKFSLRETRGGEGNFNEPYRLFNVDIFEYEVNSPMAMYGAIPFMQAHKKGSSVAIFWSNAAETWIDITKTKPNDAAFGVRKSTRTHWISESGIVDVFIMLGPNPTSVYQQYGLLTGFTALPPIYAIGYHQCRWNYNSEEDVEDVDANFDKHEIPYDAIWLDIEYTDSKKYFTWAKAAFPTPEKMLQNLEKRKRKLVVIIDPHIKKESGYQVYEGLSKNKLAIQTEEQQEYNGWCWPGESAWIDTFNPKAIEYWKEQFKPGKFCAYETNLLLWNDMNEPSVFNGPEVSAPRDNIHYGNWEHRDVHNVYGMTFQNATHQALIARNPKQRPFILTRAFFAGSQRLGAVWTGDNAATWDYLKIATPMILSHSVAGFSFVGADVGGFFGNPTVELLTRWYQAGAFYPFFRGHAHIESKRREPYLFGEPTTSIIKNTIRLRYQLLPSLYTAFHRASFDGVPIIRPLFLLAPDNEDALDIDDQFFFGETGLLIKPIVEEGATSTEIYLPDDEVYYDYLDYTIYEGIGRKHYYAPLEKIPILARGGHIFTRRDRYRRSATLMQHDPITLVINLDKDGNAAGVLYLDDGETTAYARGAYVHRFFVFTAQDNVLRSRSVQPSGTASRSYEKSIDSMRVEKIVLVGFNVDKLKISNAVEAFQDKKSWKSEITIVEEAEGKASVVTVRDPKVLVSADWSIQF